jgi:hypothetical protein
MANRHRYIVIDIVQARDEFNACALAHCSASLADVVSNPTTAMEKTQVEPRSDAELEN